MNTQKGYITLYLYLHKFKTILSSFYKSESIREHKYKVIAEIFKAA